MDTPIQDPEDPAARRARIKANVAKMQSMGASESEIDDYLQRREGLKPKASTSGNIDLRQQADDTRVTPAPSTTSQSGAGEGVLDSGLDMLTLGAHSKLLGLTQAAGDVLTHGTGSHPVDTYNASLAATDKRKAAADVEHPLLRRAADATGFFGSLAAEAPARAALGFAKTVAPAGTASTAIARIGQAAKASAGHGAQYGALAGALGSRAPTPDQAINDVGKGALGGSVLGTLFGGTSATAGEGARTIESVLGPLLAPAEEKAQTLANRLIAPGVNAAAVPRRAAQAAATGNTGATLAHLGDPGLDQLTYLATSGATPEAATLRAALEDAQRGEHGIIQQGITSMSGRERAPRNEGVNFLKGLETQRKAVGAADYPVALSTPPIKDASILRDIAANPSLKKGFHEAVGMAQSDANLAAMEGRGPQRTIQNPLETPDVAPVPLTKSIDALYRDDPVMAEIAKAQLAKQGGPPAVAGETPGIPVDILNNFKQGIDATVEKGMNGRPLNRKAAGVTNSMLQNILQRGDKQAPAFAEARARQIPFFNRIEGGEAGQDAFGKNGGAIQSEMNDLSKVGQNEAYRTTATSALRGLVDKQKYNRDVGSMFDSPEVEGQLDALFGQGARERLEPALEQGSILNRVLGSSATKGSQTAYRTKINENLGDPAINDVIHTILNPKRAIYNLPGKLIDRAGKTAQQEALRINAGRLATPANSPDLPSVLASILEPAPAYGSGPLREAPRGFKPGVLSHLLFQGDQ